MMMIVISTRVRVDFQRSYLKNSRTVCWYIRKKKKSKNKKKKKKGALKYKCVYIYILYVYINILMCKGIYI